MLMMALNPVMQVFDNVCWCLFIFEFFTGLWDTIASSPLWLLAALPISCSMEQHFEDAVVQAASSLQTPPSSRLPFSGSHRPPCCTDSTATPKGAGEKPSRTCEPLPKHATFLHVDMLHTALAWLSFSNMQATGDVPHGAASVCGPHHIHPASAAAWSSRMVA